MFINMSAPTLYISSNHPFWARKPNALFHPLYGANLAHPPRVEGRGSLESETAVLRLGALLCLDSFD